MQYNELMDKVIDQAYDEIEQSGRSAFDYINAMNNFQLIEYIKTGCPNWIGIL